MIFEVCHGCLEEEKIVPNTFSVDFEGVFSSQCAEDDDLAGTVNYAEVYNAVRAVMEGSPRNLLETLASDIIDTIRTSLPEFSEIRVCVSKKNPPVGGKCEWARIEEKWKRNG